MQNMDMSTLRRIVTALQCLHELVVHGLPAANAMEVANIRRLTFKSDLPFNSTMETFRSILVRFPDLEYLQSNGLVFSRNEDRLVLSDQYSRYYFTAIMSHCSALKVFSSESTSLDLAMAMLLADKCDQSLQSLTVCTVDSLVLSILLKRCGWSLRSLILPSRCHEICTTTRHLVGEHQHLLEGRRLLFIVCCVYRAQGIDTVHQSAGSMTFVD